MTGAVQPAFRENEIDADLLPGLTGEDRKDLGVTVVSCDLVGSTALSARLDPLFPGKW
jgi:class 3 adenylate cyclase